VRDIYKKGVNYSEEQYDIVGISGRTNIIINNNPAQERRPISPSRSLFQTCPALNPNTLLLVATKELGLELVGQANGGLVGHKVFLLLGLRLWGPGHSVACASTAGVVVSAVLARSNSSFRNDVLILAVGGWCAYISDVSSAYVWDSLAVCASCVKSQRLGWRMCKGRRPKVFACRVLRQHSIAQ
jgi:hypothetical protein